MNYEVKLRIRNKTEEARRNLVPLFASMPKKTIIERLPDKFI
jgi:hypothetical protein